MIYKRKYAHWMARLRAPVVSSLVFALFGCNSTDTLTPESSTPSDDTPEVLTVDDGMQAALTYRGGIPFGAFALPTSSFGSIYNGALQNRWPEYLLSELKNIKARGGKVVLMFAGWEGHYKDRYGHFDFGKWKARVNRFRNVNFSSYVRDGTIIGHYLIDEPQDPYNWNGRPIPQSTVEAMAQYSKSLWPSMTTVVRAEPTWLRKWSGSYRALDAAWAQYTARRGSVTTYINGQVNDARAKGLGLIVGLNLLHGGNPNLTPMNATEVANYGSALLASSYPCAFISWKYSSTYLSSSSIRSAMQKLSSRAANRATKSCRG
ncbi:MAG TPA: hypothetical protein VFB61_08660 [Gemmatimonadales bacterium]|nr:hypothetical protein [Gemmatimonadales bacterium]